MFVVTRLGGGNGRQPEQQTAATRSKMRANSEEWRIGRMSRKAGGERLGAQVRNCHLHGSRALKSLKFPMAQGQNTVLVQHLRSGVGGESTRIAEITEGYCTHPASPAVAIIRTGGPRCVR